ncbi:MAG: PIG-L family deacetylase [Verrucomicrobiia bacterium]
MNPFQKYVWEHARLLKGGKDLPLGKLKPSGRRANTPSGAPKALIFSPHPDDESIVGGLALRLLREARWNVINVAVTLGSQKGRRAARLRELQNACALLGFGLIVPKERGLEQITLKSRKQKPAQWKAAVNIIAQILAEQRPRVIFVPHENDWHPAHVGTHFLVLDALKTLPAGCQCHVVETEFWGPMANPNLLVELDAAEAGDLVAALACHAGEVRRNPYHARLPAWLIDNVRRGAELAGGQGGAAPDFTFGTICHLQRWSRGRLTAVEPGRRFWPRAANVGKLFR